MELFDDKIRKGKKVREQQLRRSFSSSSSNSSGGKSHNELILKVASNIKGNNVSGSVDYIARNKTNNEIEEFIEPFNEVGEVLDRDELEQLKSEWKTEFSDEKKINTRNMTHFVFSIDVEPTEENKRKFDAATREFLNERFGDEGFRYIAVQHEDTSKPHFHVLVNNNNLETKKKLRIDINWHYESRLMAKEHLKNHDIVQEASFKKDRQVVKQKSLDAEKEYQQVTNWYDAKLKTVSRNDAHFKQLQSQLDVINGLRLGLSTGHKQNSRIGTQQAIDVNQKIQQIKRDMLTYERYTNRTEANQALREVIKFTQPDSSVIKQALNQTSKREVKQQKQNQRQAYFMAKELVQGEQIVKASADFKPKEKRQILKTIASQKQRFSDMGIDIKKIERQYHSELSDNKQFVNAMKAINSVERGTERQIKKDGRLDNLAAEKRVLRLLDVIHTAKQTKLSQNEEKQLNQAKSEAFKVLDSKKINTKKIEANWQQARAFKDKVAELKQSLDPKVFNASKANDVQERIISLSETLHNAPPRCLGTKERQSLNVSLTRSQEALNRHTNNDFKKLDKPVQRLVKNLTSLDVKQKEQPKKAKQQAYAMIKQLLTIEKQILTANVTASQKQILNNQTQQVSKELEQRGFSVAAVKKRLELTEQLLKQTKEIKGMSMQRARVTGFDKVERQIDEVKESLSKADLKRDDKRTIQKELASTSKEIKVTREADVVKLDKNIEQIDIIASKIKQLRDPQYQKSLTNLERLNNKREIENAGKTISDLVKQSLKLVPALPNKSVQQSYSKTLNSAAQLTKGQSHQISR